MFKHAILTILLLVGMHSTSHSATIDYSLADLNNFIDEAPTTGDDLSRFIGSEIQAALDRRGIHLDENGLTVTGDLPDQQIRGGCTANTRFHNGSYTIRVDSQSRLEIVLDTLKKPINASLDLLGYVGANGSATIKYGFKFFGRCVKYATDNVGLSVSADIGINIGLQIDLKPTLIEDPTDGSIIVVITPDLQLSGRVTKFSNQNLDISDFDTIRVLGLLGGGVFGAILFDYLVNVGETIAENSYTVTDLDNMFQAALIDQNRSLRIQLAEALLPTEEYAIWKTSFDIPGNNPPITVEYKIPGLTDEVLQKIHYFVSKLPTTFPITHEFLKNNQRDIVYNLLIGDYDAALAILGSSVACQASYALLTPMQTTPLYAFSSACNMINVADTNQQGPFYTDANCQNVANYKPTPYANYCQEVLPTNNVTLGNAALLDGVDPAWSLSPGTQFNVGALSIKNNFQPFMYRENYKTTLDPDYSVLNQAKIDEFMSDCITSVTNEFDYGYALERCPLLLDAKITKALDPDYNALDQAGMDKFLSDCITASTNDYGYEHARLWRCPRLLEQEISDRSFKITIKGKGECKLEMRVYKKDITATNLKPMIAFHGGSWKYRGAAFVGMETQISHYTEKGFAVFVPFYRLIGSSDGNSECNQVTWNEIVDDAESALDWVNTNMTRFGASGKVSVMGQSAGGQIAGWLATYRNTEVANVLLYYPAIDTLNFIEQFRAGNPQYTDGQGTLEAFVGDGLDTVDLTTPAVTQNSFPDIISTNPSIYPRMFIIHGKRDNLVPSEQSVRMCNALSGYADSGTAVNDGGNLLNNEYKKVYQCDERGSRLHLTAEGEHGMDICVTNLLCLSGTSDASIAATATTIDAGNNWLYNSNTSDQNWIYDDTSRQFKALINIITNSIILN